MTSTLGIKKIQYPNGTNIATLDSSGSIAFAGASTVAGTLGVTGAITGTLATAAQTNITSVGTLTNFRSTGIDDNSNALSITIDASERVGIFETTPQAGLQITSTNNDLSKIRLAYSTSNHYMEIGRQAGYYRVASFEDGQSLTFGTSRSAGATTERMRIDADGRVMIGTTTLGESSADDLTIATTGQTGITIRSGTSNAGSIYFSDGTSGTDQYDGYIAYSHSNRTMYVYTGVNYGFAIDGQNHTIDVNDAGNRRLRISNNGINFGTDTAAANALDDYEEGTWTPALTNSYGSRQGTWGSSLSGTYTKVGRKVTIFAVIIGSGMYFSSERGYQQLTGMPFNANHTGMAAPYAGSWGAGNVTHSNAGTVYLYSGSMYIHSPGSNVDTSGTGGIGITITYFT